MKLVVTVLLLIMSISMYFLISPKEEGLPAKIKKFSMYSSLLLASLFVVLLIFKDTADDNRYKKEPSFYDTGNVRDMNMKEYSDFLKWKDKQRRKEIEEQKIFK